MNTSEKMHKSKLRQNFYTIGLNNEQKSMLGDLAGLNGTVQLESGIIVPENKILLFRIGNIGVLNLQVKATKSFSSGIKIATTSYKPSSVMQYPCIIGEVATLINWNEKGEIIPIVNVSTNDYLILNASAKLV